MAVFYVDPFNGNDANSGSSWADAKKTIQLYGTAADQTRVARSPVTNMGITASWSNLQSSLIAATALGTQVDEAVGNTWASGITGVTLGTYSIRRIGSSSQQVAITSAFGGGKAAWKALPEQTDLSMYDKLCLFVSGSNVNNFNNFNPRICLCSDASGNNIVDDLPLGTISQTNAYMHAITIHKPGGLGDSIGSIALYLSNVTSTLYIRLNAIYATALLDNHSIISSNDDPYANMAEVVCVDDTQISLGSQYVGLSGDFNIFKTLPAKVVASSTTAGAILLDKDYDSLTGGYDTATNEPAGMTWLHGLIGVGTGFNHTNRKLHIANFGFCRYLHPPISGYRIASLKNIYAISCSGSNGVLQANRLENIRMISCGNLLITQAYEFYHFEAYDLNTITVNRGSLPVPSFFKDILVEQCEEFIVDPGTYHFVFINLSIIASKFKLLELSCTYYNFQSDASNYEAHGNFINSCLLEAENQKKPRFANQLNINAQAGNNRTNRFSGFIYVQEHMRWIPADEQTFPGNPGRWIAQCNSSLDVFTPVLPVPYRLIEMPVSAASPVIFKVRLYYNQQPQARLIIRSFLTICIDSDIIESLPYNGINPSWVQVPLYVNPLHDGILSLELQILSGEVSVGDIEIVS